MRKTASRKGLFGLLLLTAAMILHSPRPAAAQEEISITINSAEVLSLYAVRFKVQAFSNADIERVVLHYGTDSRSCQAGGGLVSMDLNPAKYINLSWEWSLSESGALPLGSVIWWQWELTDANGMTTWTERETLPFDARRHDWFSLTEDIVTVQWYSGSQAFGRQLLDFALRGLDRLEEITGFRPEEPIHIVVYPTAAEVRLVLISTYEWTGGIALPEYNTTIIGIGPDELAWAEQVIPHELAHLVVGMMSFNCYGVDLPIWLHEGLAEYAEGPLASWRQDDLVRALESQQLAPLRSLAGGFSAYADSASLSYSHSGAVVSYLVSEYGADSISELISTVQNGTAIDPAMSAVYGFDTDGLDNRWRLSVGFEASQSTQRSSGPLELELTAVPTVALWTPVFGPSATPSPGPTDTSAPTATPQAVAALPEATPAPQPAPTQMPPAPAIGSRAALLIGVPTAIALALGAAYLLRRKGG